jgi:hypothetical protein
MSLPARVALGYALLLAATWFLVARKVALDAPLPSLTPTEQSQVIANLRSIVDGRGPQPVPAATAWRGVATVWCKGEVTARADLASRAGQLTVGDDLIGEKLRALTADERATCRIKVDVLGGRAPVISSVDLLFAASLVPGIDGLGMQYAGHEILILPDELLRGDLLAGHRPLPSVDFDVGLDTRAAVNELARRAGLDGNAWKKTPHQIFRFRTLGFVEPAVAGAPVPILRGNSPGPSLTRATLRASIVDGGHYLRNHLHPSGRFDYEYYPGSDQGTGESGDYSLARHAGAALFLAQAAGATKDQSLATASRDALRFLVAAAPDGCDRPELACVGETGPHDGPRVVDLGTSALALSAAVEYQRATGDTEFAAWARRLAEFLLMMQKENGDFCHLYEPSTNTRNEKTRLLYFSGEAALALAKLDSLAPEPRFVAAVDKTLGYLTSDLYDGAFAANFFYGEDHWTCIALGDAWDRLPAGPRRDRYGDYCEGYAAFARRSQFLDGDPALEAQPDLAGSYGFSPLMPPHPTPVGSRTEAFVATFEVAQKRGRSAEAATLRAQILAAFRFLLAHQLRDDGAYLSPSPKSARGGWLMSDVKRSVRIDFIQHCGAAMLRGEPLVDD